MIGICKLQLISSKIQSGAHPSMAGRFGIWVTPPLRPQGAVRPGEEGEWETARLPVRVVRSRLARATSRSGARPPSPAEPYTGIAPQPHQRCNISARQLLAAGHSRKGHLRWPRRSIRVRHVRNRPTRCARRCDRSRHRRQYDQR